MPAGQVTPGHTSLRDSALCALRSLSFETRLSVFEMNSRGKAKTSLSYTSGKAIFEHETNRQETTLNCNMRLQNYLFLQMKQSYTWNKESKILHENTI